MRHQQGASYIGILVAVIGLCFMVKIAIAVWGPYWDDKVINSQIEELVVASPANITPNAFMAQLQQRFDMNNVRDVQIKEIMKVDNSAGIHVQKDYEIRKPFLLNIDLVLKFEKSFDKSSVQAK